MLIDNLTLHQLKHLHNIFRYVTHVKYTCKIHSSDIFISISSRKFFAIKKCLCILLIFFRRKNATKGRLWINKQLMKFVETNLIRYLFVHITGMTLIMMIALNYFHQFI